ncbi:MAG: cell division protein FtsQ/DivIB [Mangrovibacterium sp.]
MFKKLVHIALFVLMVAVIISSLAFSSGKLSKVMCNELKVIIPDSSPRFIDEEEVTRLIRKADANLLEKQLNAINAETLEVQLEKTPAIKNAEVFRHITGDRLDFNGKLVVEVHQREPLFRVISGDRDFYIDEEGVSIPANPKFTAHVLLVTGKADEKYAREKLLPFVNYIESDDFWKAQVRQVHVEADGEIILVPLIGDQLIEFGEPVDYHEKLRNLKALYEQGFAQTGWARYKKISLKYKNQVVCTKK